MFDSIFNFNIHNRNQFVANEAKLTPTGSTVLDAGAGQCHYKPLFSHCEYRAQDFAKYPGKEHVYGELDYICDITEIPVPNASFDMILCTEVLEHIPRPDLALREFSRIIKPGGRLVLTAPLGSGIHMPPYHFYGGFSPYWYEHFCSEHGLTVESCEPNGGFFKLFGQESRRFAAMARPRSLLLRIALFPLEVVVRVFFSLLLPVICHLLDGCESEGQFTVGYFVTAQKQ